MTLKIAHFLYHEITQIREWKKHKVYHQFIQHLSLLCILRLFVYIYIFEHPNEDVNEIYPFIQYDSIAYAIAAHRDQFDSFFLLALIFFCLYTLKITRKTYLDDSNFDTIQVSYELTVILWNNYLNSIKPKKAIARDKCMHLLHAKVLVSKRKIIAFLPRILWKKLLIIKLWISFYSQIQFIDIDNFQKVKSYQVFQNLSIKSKIKTLKILIALDKIYFAILAFICKGRTNCFDN